jgi:hypothetical protein
MFPLPISTYIYAGLILLSVIGFSYGRYEHNKYVTFKAEVEAVAKTQEAKVESIQKQHQLVTKGISDEYDAKLALIRQYYANGVRSPSSSSLSSVPDPTKPTSFIPTNNLLADCAQTTLMLTELQKWYLEVAGIK